MTSRPRYSEESTKDAGVTTPSPPTSQPTPRPTAETPADSADSAVPARGKRRRRAVYVSEADRRLLELGLPPSWDQKISDADLSVEQDAGAGHVATDSASNDRRLMQNVPPHAHARM